MPGDNRYNPTLVGDTLPERIRALLQRLGSVTKSLSYADFARLVGEKTGRPVGTSTAHRWATDVDVPPDAYDIAGIAALANTTVEQLMAGLTPPAVRRKNKTKKAKRAEPKHGGKVHYTAGEAGRRKRTAG